MIKATLPTAQAAPKTSIVRLEGARKIYRMGTEEVHALAGVSVGFERGSFWSIMGPSGSGKSTMMNILGCLDRLTEGRYLLEGRDVSGMDDNQLSTMRLRHIGFIFQNFNLIPQLTVQRNIELPLYYLGIDAAESKRRAAELGDRVGLGHRLNHRPAELSGGQMQRVAIARALATIRRLSLLTSRPAIWIRVPGSKSWSCYANSVSKARPSLWSLTKPT